ncbi:MAG: proline--tRNA ligase [Thermoprotei archaeon]|nr:proline--tRNA ligase [TACK group archaeon]
MSGESKAKARGIEAGKEDLSEWYSQVLIRTGFVDFSPVGGFIVLMPPAMFVWDSIREAAEVELDREGVKNSYFPLLIPEGLLRKEAEHFSGFTPEVAWVTEAGDQKLDERLAIRPTSETIMYTMFSRWIHGPNDLPLKLNQWNSVVRWETSATRPFLRTKEFLWQEAHTAHATEHEALEQTERAIDMYERLLRETIAVPVLKGYKSDKEKFKGAVRTYTLEAMMPDGKAIQMATSHYLGQNFSVPFEISFVDESGVSRHVWQTSWGFSWRVIGAMIMCHGDDKGMVIPPKVSPVQVAVVPVVYKGKPDPTPEARTLAEELKAAGLRVIVDDRQDKTPGYKYNEWEMKGVPLRIEVGPRDVGQGTVVLARRDTGQKLTVKRAEAVQATETTLDEVQRNLYERAKLRLDSMTYRVSSLDEVDEVVKKRAGFAVTAWCGSRECEDRLYQRTGATIRLVRDIQEPAKCVVCGAPAKQLAYVAKAY